METIILFLLKKVFLLLLLIILLLLLLFLSDLKFLIGSVYLEKYHWDFFRKYCTGGD